MKHLLILCMILFTATAFAQTNETPTEEEVMETLPEYPGGWMELRREVQRQYRMPAIPNDLESGKAKIMVEFVVDVDGNVVEAQVQKGFDGIPGANEEALRVMNNLKKKFTPGTQEGQPVRVRYILPIALAWN